MDQAKIVGIIIRGIINVCNELLTAGGDPAVSPTAPPLTAGMPGAPGAGKVPAPPGPGETITGNAPGDGEPGAGAADTKKVPPPPDEKKETPKTGPVVKLDKEGLPWDARIHTAKKSVLKSGVWRLKPGCDPVLVAQVKSELTLAAQAAAQETGAAGPTEDESGADPELTEGAEEFTWANLISLIVEKGCAPDAVLKACKDCGVDNIGKLQESPEQIPTVRVILGI